MAPLPPASQPVYTNLHLLFPLSPSSDQRRADPASNLPLWLQYHHHHHPPHHHPARSRRVPPGPCPHWRSRDRAGGFGAGIFRPSVPRGRRPACVAHRRRLDGRLLGRWYRRKRTPWEWRPVRPCTRAPSRRDATTARRLHRAARGRAVCSAIRCDAAGFAHRPPKSPTGLSCCCSRRLCRRRVSSSRITAAASSDKHGNLLARRRRQAQQNVVGQFARRNHWHIACRRHDLPSEEYCRETCDVGCGQCHEPNESLICES